MKKASNYQQEEAIDLQPDSTSEAEWLKGIHPLLQSAIVSKGFTELTAVQRAVLNPALTDRDLRISSQTGSGKTVAIGLYVSPIFTGEPSETKASNTPRVLILTPTRELAHQVCEELAWLYDHLRVRVVSVTGGTSASAERRTLKQGVDIVVGTPGRMLDHLESSALNASNIQVVVLDEADQMLDLGFRDELEAILKKLPEARRSHLMSATFSPEVQRLANQYQTNAVSVEGTRLGQANADIRHIAHLIYASERDAVMINLLLMAPDDSTLVFTRTREGATELATQLGREGFSVSALTGDMEQRERTRTLHAFRTGHVRILVATDVAARGLDVEGITRVIHADPPGDPDTYTHRSGRTGRAGRKGLSITLVPSGLYARATHLFRQANIKVQFEPVPTEREIRRVAYQNLLATLTSTHETTEDKNELDLKKLAEELLQQVDPLPLVVRLLTYTKLTGPTLPRSITTLAPPTSRGKESVSHKSSSGGQRSSSSRSRHENFDRGGELFEINWGSQDGADARRLTAMVCRRGAISSSNLGAIEVNNSFSKFFVSSQVADQFARMAQKPDARDPQIQIRRVQDNKPYRESQTTRTTYRDRTSRSTSSQGFSSKERKSSAEKPSKRERA